MSNLDAYKEKEVGIEVKLKKIVESKMGGEHEITKTHIIKLKLKKELSDILCDIVEQNDDAESQYYSYGISTNFDGEIVCINLDILSKQLKYEIENPDEDGNPKRYYKNLMIFLDKYKGYTLWQ